MAVTVKVLDVDHTLGTFIVDGTLTLSGNYGGGATHGDVVDLSQTGVPTHSLPFVIVTEAPAAGALGTFNRLLYCPGTTQANGVLQVLGAAAEYAQGSAYGANFPNPIRFRAFFLAGT